VPGRKILVVDDEAAIRSLLTEFLTDLGFDTAYACNGLDALEMVQSYDPDLLIIDLVMPEQEGIETIRTLRSTHKDLKIVAVSGAFAGQFLRTAELLGANAVLPKPLDLQELTRLVNALLG